MAAKRAEYHKNRTATLMASGKCIKHCKVDAVPGRVSCQACLDSQNKSAKQRLQQNKLNKKCVRHPYVDAASGKTVCADCLAHFNQYFKDKRAIRDGKCKICKDPVSPPSQIYCLGHKTANTIKTQIKECFKSGGIHKRERTFNIIGVGAKEFLAYIAAQFQPGMNWQNRGNGPGKWNIDHIRPLASFDFSDPKQVSQAWHHTNLRPIWYLDNLAKGDRWTPDAD